MAKPTYQAVFTNVIPNEAHSFDLAAFDDGIRSQGVKFVHYQSQGCPVGMVDRSDSMRRPHDDHEGCSNGFIYKKVGEVTCLFTSNSNSKNSAEFGMLDGSSVQVSMPRFYDDKCEKPVLVAIFDRLYLAEESIAVVNWQLINASITGTDKLTFPAVSVESLIDSAGLEYQEGQDFCVRQGSIHWETQRRPGTDPNTGLGRVYSVRYTYRPFFYIRSFNHEVRVVQAEDPATGERRVWRMPQAVAISRENVPLGQDADPQAKDAATSRRQTPGPEPFAPVPSSALPGLGIG